MRYFLLLFLSVLPLMSQAQYAENIRSGRPGASIGPFTVGKQIFQIQTGGNFAKISYDYYTVSTSHVPVVMRFGLWERIEVNGLLAYSKLSQRGENTVTDHNEGLSAAQIGVRVNILDGRGSGLSMGLQSRLKLNVLSEEFDHDRAAVNIILAMSHPLGKKLGVTANLGVDTPGDHASNPYGGKPTGLYTLNFGASLSKKILAFVETFGTYRQQEWNTQFDTGLAYLVSPDLQLDASVGYGKNQGVENTFIDFGLSWRAVGSREAGEQ